MNINLAESHINEKLDIDIPEFIRNKAEAEGLYDYEIARILNLEIRVIRKVKKFYGIKRSNCFTRRFDERYGKSSTKTFQRIIENPYSSLAEVARHFGFSREYARQVYMNIYGHPYTKVHREKLEIRRIKKKEVKKRRR
ncbi:MAG: hypothetical protein SWO11_00600 [Thermodesulfobacteriota bacterium]|nr:hypothetical protein [Thermodesulfobacteriota bacterium]